MIWTKERLNRWIFGDNEAAAKVEEGVGEETNRMNLVNELTSHMVEEEEVDCPIHGKLGGINECPRC